MRDGDLTYDDYLRRLNIQDVLIDAGLPPEQAGRPSLPFVCPHGQRRTAYPWRQVHSDGQRTMLFPATAAETLQYNIVHQGASAAFAEYRTGVSPDRLVNLVCCRLLNHPIEERSARILQPKRDIRPFDIEQYELHKFNPQDRETQKRFYPYFKSRGIDLYTQYAFTGISVWQPDIWKTGELIPTCRFRLSCLKSRRRL